MALRLHEKEAICGDMTERLGRTTAMLVADYRGLTVAELRQLRSVLREDGAEIQVIKNSLLRRACDAAGLEPPDGLLAGPTAVVLLYEDLSKPVKALLDFAKKHEELEIRGGLLEGRPLDAAGVKALADLPTKDELRAMLLGVLAGPSRQLVTVLQAPLRGLAAVINARVEAGDAGEEAA